MTKETLANNDIDYDLFITTKPPYDWYFRVDSKPIMVNYDELKHGSDRFLVSLVKPLRPDEEYKMVRRNSDVGMNALSKFINNSPMLESTKSSYSVFFHINSRGVGEKLSKEYPGKIWFMGRYFDSRYNVCLVNNMSVLAFLDDKDIILEKTSVGHIGEFETEFNYRILKGREYLVKFTDTPYFLGGTYHKPKIRGDMSKKFTLT